MFCTDKLLMRYFIGCRADFVVRHRAAVPVPAAAQPAGAATLLAVPSSQGVDVVSVSSTALASDAGWRVEADVGVRIK